MSNYESMITRQRKWMFYLLAIIVLGAGFTPYPRIFLGLLLGSTVSFYNLWLLQKKMDSLGEAVVRKQKPRGVGYFARLAAVAFAIIIALQYEAYFHLFAVIIGLMTSYLVIIIDFLVFELKRND
ncbi:ATP synthase subunit I [Virgibacillus doumboii]|uniref:ATP synthase subunit I n=1 Tax=Virgibacillus doumboii TaxID=2697503 RepID=UPI0013DFD06D|nr:ATP synthase subunit I [Virgibacillus doumboii]